MALNKKRIVLFIIILFLFSLVVFGLYLFNIRDFLRGGKLDSSITKADESEGRALIIISRLMRVTAIDVVNHPQSAKRRYLEADIEAREARKELEAAISEMEEIKDLKVPMWQKNYADLRIQSLSSRIRALDSLERWFSKMELVADFLKRTNSAQQKFKQGLEKINESIEDCNNKNYDRAKTNASKGKQFFDESQKLLQEADKMDRSAGLDSVLTIVSKAQDFASLTIQLAEAGASGKIDEYNEIAQKCDSSEEEVLKDWKPEAIKEPEKWYSKKVKTLEKSIDNYLMEASELRESATVLYRNNTR
jgi:flagellar basal body-associated protein FliL/uncharacterized protein YukE